MAIQEDIPALPTYWSEGRVSIAKILVNTQVYENKIHLVAMDHVGVECGTRAKLSTLSAHACHGQ